VRVRCNGCIIAEKERPGEKILAASLRLYEWEATQCISSSQHFKGPNPASFTRTVAHENDREPYPKNLTGPLNPL